MKRILAAAAFLAASSAFADTVHRCEIDGRTVFQDRPCPGEVVIPENPPGSEKLVDDLKENLRQGAERDRQRQRSALPYLDVEAWCQAVAASGGGFSQSIYNGCIRREQSAHDDMKASYYKVPRNIREWCVRVADSGAGGSYSTLKGCILREAEAAIDAPHFSR